MKLWALNFSATGKVAIGHLTFMVDSQGILSPQPTDDDVQRLKIGGYLVKVDAPKPTAPVAAEEPPAEAVVEETPAAPAPLALEAFEVSVEGGTSTDTLPPPVDDDDLFDEEPATTSAPATGVYDKLPLPQLRKLAVSAKIPNAKTMEKADLIKALSEKA